MPNATSNAVMTATVMNKKSFRAKPKWFKGKGKGKPVTIARVKRLIDAKQETKYYDAYVSATGVSTSGTFNDCTAIAAGTTNSTRLGNIVEALWIKCIFESNIADTTNFMRYILFQWNNDTAGLTPTLAGVLAQTGVLSSPINCQYQISDTRDIRILLDVTHTLNVNSPNVRTEHMVPMKGKRIPFQSSATTGNQHIYLLQVSDSGAVAHPTSEFFLRLAFKDA